MASSPPTEKVIPYALLGMTAVTGLVDAVSFLSLGRVFTANMTGNVVILAFATARVPGLSIVYSLTALLNGALVVSSRGDIRRTNHGPSRRGLRDSIRGTSVPAGRRLSLCCVVVRHRIQTRLAGTLFSTLCSDRPDGARDGHTECRCPQARNTRSDDNGPDTNDYGHRRGLFDRERQQPKIGEKGCVGRCNAFGCGVGCGHHTLLHLSGLVAGDSDLRVVQCGIVSLIAHVRSAVRTKLAFQLGRSTRLYRVQQRSQTL